MHSGAPSCAQGSVVSSSCFASFGKNKNRPPKNKVCEIGAKKSGGWGGGATHNDIGMAPPLDIPGSAHEAGWD